MIANFSVENFFSIKSAQKISFVPTSDTFMSDEYSYEVKEGVRLLKVGIIYGANASGKTNILNAIEFFRMLVLRMPKDRNEKTGVVPFMLDDTSRDETTKMSMVFYINQSKYVLINMFLALNWMQGISIPRHWLFMIPFALPSYIIAAMMLRQIPRSSSLVQI